MAQNNITLEGMADIKVKDFNLLSNLFWGYQDKKIADYTLLTYGNYGLYVYQVVNNPSPAGMTWKNGKQTDKGFKHFINALSEQEETGASVRVGLRTGREIPVNGGTSTFDKPSTIDDTFESFDLLLAIWDTDSNNVNHFNFWAKAWHIAYASKVGLLPRKLTRLYRDDNHLADEKKWNFAVDNVLKMSPEAMRQTWLKLSDNQPEKPETSPKKRVGSVPTTAMSVAMADKTIA